MSSSDNSEQSDLECTRSPDDVKETKPNTLRKYGQELSCCSAYKYSRI